MTYSATLNTPECVHLTTSTFVICGLAIQFCSILFVECELHNGFEFEYRLFCVSTPSMPQRDCCLFYCARLVHARAPSVTMDWLSISRKKGYSLCFHTFFNESILMEVLIRQIACIYCTYIIHG